MIYVYRLCLNHQQSYYINRKKTQISPSYVLFTKSTPLKLKFSSKYLVTKSWVLYAEFSSPSEVLLSTSWRGELKIEVLQRRTQGWSSPEENSRVKLSRGELKIEVLLSTKRVLLSNLLQISLTSFGFWTINSCMSIKLSWICSK